MKRILCLLALLLTLFPAIAQNYEAEELNYAGPGVDVIIAGGMYFGSAKTAAYYSGIPTNENNLDYIFGNKYWKDDIVKIISDNNNFVSPSDATIYVQDYPEKMHYKVAMSVSIGASYRFDKHWRISLYYTFARLSAVGIFNVHYDNRVPGNDRPEFLPYNLIGKENRSFFDLTGSYTFQFNKYIKPYFEIGAQFNFVRVKSFDAIIEGREFTLLDRYGGNTYVPGADMQIIEPHYGGPGFAFSGNVGVQVAFSKSVSLAPCFYISFGKIDLEGYKEFHFNYGAYIRLIMSDAMFKR
ncbi:MAG: hypothetical protein J5644_00105 [Bacteroidales bacterium]|nr:hypothetical protein [Bacteroidales bacterium]